MHGADMYLRGRRDRRLAERGADGAARAVQRARTASATSAMSASATPNSTGISQPQSCETPKASELFAQCSPMHGYSEPVCS